MYTIMHTKIDGIRFITWWEW